jgi:hypothetical protein
MYFELTFQTKIDENKQKPIYNNGSLLLLQALITKVSLHLSDISTGKWHLCTVSRMALACGIYIFQSIRSPKCKKAFLAHQNRTKGRQILTKTSKDD